MKNCKNERGITLVALIITIIVMVIIAGVAVSTGTESLDETKLKGFYTKLEIVQKRADDIASTNESYVNDSGATVYIKEQGIAYSSLDTTKKATLDNIIETEGTGLGLIASNFRYFTSNQLENIFDLSEIEYNVFIDFDNRIVIAENGIKIKGETYHILKNSIYFAEQDTNKNVGTINSLTYTASKYGANKYKIIITPSNTIGDLDEGTLKYKKTSTKYWETSTKLEMIVDELTDYNIVYEDANNNTLAKTINISLNSEGELTVTEE